MGCIVVNLKCDKCQDINTSFKTYSYGNKRLCYKCLKKEVYKGLKLKYPFFRFLILKLLGENQFIEQSKIRIDYINKVRSLEADLKIEEIIAENDNPAPKLFVSGQSNKQTLKNINKAEDIIKFERDTEVMNDILSHTNFI